MAGIWISKVQRLSPLIAWVQGKIIDGAKFSEGFRNLGVELSERAQNNNLVDMSLTNIYVDENSKLQFGCKKGDGRTLRHDIEASLRWMDLNVVKSRNANFGSNAKFDFDSLISCVANVFISNEQLFPNLVKHPFFMDHKKQLLFWLCLEPSKRLSGFHAMLKFDADLEVILKNDPTYVQRNNSGDWITRLHKYGNPFAKAVFTYGNTSTKQTYSVGPASFNRYCRNWVTHTGTRDASEAHRVITELWPGGYIGKPFEAALQNDIKLLNDNEW